MMIDKHDAPASAESQYHRRSDTVLCETNHPIRYCKCGCSHVGTVNLGGGPLGGEGEKWFMVLFLGRCNGPYCRCQSYKMGDGREQRR